MSNEIWTHWKPIERLAARYYVDSIIFNEEGFKVILSEENNKDKKVDIIFENSVFAYRHINETFRYNLLLKLAEVYGREFLVKLVFL